MTGGRDELGAQTKHCRHHPLVTLQAGPRTVPPEPCDRGINQRRVSGRHSFVAQSHPVGHTRLERLDERIGPAGHGSNPFDALLISQVCDHALPASGQEWIGGGPTPDKPRPLYPKNLGPKIPQSLTHLNPGCIRRQIHYPTAGKRRS